MYWALCTLFLKQHYVWELFLVVFSPFNVVFSRHFMGFHSVNVSTTIATDTTFLDSQMQECIC